MDQTKDLAVQQWQICKDAILSGEDDIIILDELTYILTYGWVAVEEVVEVLRQRPAMLHVIITGRDAPAELIEYADLVTEMQVIKHPYRDQGIKAQPGIEF